MKRVNRLTSSGDFRRTLARGQRSTAGSVVATCVSRGSGVARVGVSASKRVGNAVQRNRVKRLLRVAASGALPVIPDGTDVVLIAKPSALGKTCQTITADVRSALTKAGIPC